MPNTFPEIVGGVSPSLHPSSLSKVREGLVDGKDSYGETRFLPTAVAAEEALTATYEFIVQVNRAEGILDEIQNDKNPTRRRQVPDGNGGIRSMYVGDVMIDRGKLRRVGEGDEELADKVGTAFTKLARLIDKRRNEITSGIGFLEGEIATTLNPRSERSRAIDVAQETAIRSHILSMGKKAIAFATGRIGKHDIETARAVLNAPAYLSGLKDDDLPKLRDLAEMTFAPERSRQLDASRKAMVAVERAGEAAMARLAAVEKRRSSKRADAKKAISEIGAGL
jgi:hypothetical protein